MFGILKLLGGVATALFGGGSGGTNQSIASEVLEKVLPETDKEKEAANLAEDINETRDEESARTYNAPDIGITPYTPGMGFIPWFLTWILDIIARVVDAVNHMIRPGFFIYLVGGLAKKWPLPDPGTVDPRMWTIFVIVVTFFFGGRALVKDILPGVKDIIMSWRK